MKENKRQLFFFIALLIVIFVGLTAVSATDNTDDDNTLLDNTNNDNSIAATNINSDIEDKIIKNDFKEVDNKESVSKKPTQLTSNIPESVSINEINGSGIEIYGYARGISQTRYYEDDDIYQDEYEGLSDESVHVVINNHNYKDLTIYELPEEMDIQEYFLDDPMSVSGYSFIFYPEDVGEYDISIIYDGNDKYQANQTEKTLNVIDKRATRLNLRDNSKVTNNNRTRGYLKDITNYYIGDKIELTFDLYYYNSKTKTNQDISGAKVSVTVDGKNNTVSKINAFTFKSIVNVKDLGNHVINISYDGEDTYQSQEIIKTFNVYNSLNLTLNNYYYDNYYYITTNYGDNITIEGKLFSNQTPLANVPVKVKRNNKDESIVYTDSEGNFSFDVFVDGLYITYSISYEGDNYYENISQQLKIYMDPARVKLTVENIEDTTVGEDIIISGRLTDLNGNGIKEYLGLYVNDVNLKKIISTDNDGYYETTFTPTNLGLNKVELYFDGNDFYAEEFANTTFTLNKKQTVIVIGNIKNKILGDTCKINVKVKNTQNKGFSNVNVKIQVNSKVYNVKTNKQGLCNITVKTDTLGVNNVNVSYAGNSKYSQANASTSFIVKKPTVISLDPIENATIENDLIVKGKIANTEGTGFSRANLLITVNGYIYNIKTNSKGIFILNSPKVLGRNEISVYYSGNSKYAAEEYSEVFYTKKDTIIELGPINEIPIDKFVYIEGRIKNSDDKGFSRADIVINIDGEISTIKSDKNGYFNFTKQIKTLGTHNVSVSYAGNSRYIPKTFNSKFDVKKDTIIRLKPIDNFLPEINYQIFGTVTNAEGKAFSNAKLRVDFNNQVFNITTNRNGEFNFTIYLEGHGASAIIVYYEGNSRYCSKSLIYPIETYKNDTIITLNPINDVKVGDNITISGTITNSKGKGFSNALVKIIINIPTQVKLNETRDEKYLYAYWPVHVLLNTIDDQPIKVYTNKYGEFSLTVNASVLGVNNVSVIYDGNSRYYEKMESIRYVVNDEPLASNVKE